MKEVGAAVLKRVAVFFNRIVKEWYTNLLL